MSFAFETYYDFVNSKEKFEKYLKNYYPSIEKPTVIYEILYDIDLIYRRGYQMEFTFIPNIKIISGYKNLINGIANNKKSDLFIKHLQRKYQIESQKHEENIRNLTNERESLAKFALYTMKKIMELVSKDNVNIESVILHEKSLCNFIEEFDQNYAKNLEKNCMLKKYGRWILVNLTIS